MSLLLGASNLECYGSFPLAGSLVQPLPGACLVSTPFTGGVGIFILKQLLEERRRLLQ